ncbi:MAG: 30S ribosomal protein S8 [Rickettsiaceae bacterium]|nr:MAG: 30S ribosomal protein S8 [Rickettsiaceae bacterium]
MSMTDRIADTLTRIRNGQKSKLISVMLPYSKMICGILNVFEEEGYISSYKVNSEGNKSTIEATLKYSKIGKPTILEIKRVSKPSKRLYSSIKNLESHYNNMGIYVLSTSSGVLSDRKARQLGIGGEVICKIF